MSTKPEKKLELQKNYILQKRGQKLKKYFYFNFLTTFHKTFTFHD